MLPLNNRQAEEIHEALPTDLTRKILGQTISLRAHQAWCASPDRVQLVDAYAVASTEALSMHALAAALSRTNVAQEAESGLRQLQSLESQVFLRYALTQRNPACRAALYSVLATACHLSNSLLRPSSQEHDAVQLFEDAEKSRGLQELADEAKRALDDASLIPLADLEAPHPLPSQRPSCEAWKRQRALDLGGILRAPPARLQALLDGLPGADHMQQLTHCINDMLTRRRTSRTRVFVDGELRSIRPSAELSRTAVPL